MRSTLRLTPLALAAILLSATTASAQSGSVTVIEATDGVYTDVADLLQGRVPGLLVSDNDGQVGAASTLRIRGGESIMIESGPLIYIDGSRIESGPLLEIGAAGVASAALDALNPEEIERIEVVRGPTASVLYGPDASGGVILIETKHGNAGRPRWSLAVDGGRGTMGHMGPTHASDVTSLSNAYTESALPTGDYDVDYLLDGEINPSGLSLNSCRGEPGCNLPGSWFRDAYLQRYNLNVSGGAGEATYFVSGRWVHQEGVVDPQARAGLDLRSNLRLRPRPDLYVTLQGAYARRGTTWIPNGDNDNGLFLNVIRGSRGYTPNNDDSQVLFEEIASEVDHVLASADVTWSPGLGTSHRWNAGFSFASGELLDYKPHRHFSSPEGVRELDQRRFHSLFADYVGRWSTTVAERFTPSISWGGQYIDRGRTSTYMRSEEFPGIGGALGVIGNGVINHAEEDRARSQALGIFVQGSVDFADRLSLSVGTRWDDYSSLAVPSARYWPYSNPPAIWGGFYPGRRFSATYRISEEAFFSAVPAIDDFRLRFAWGRAYRAPLETAHQPRHTFVLADEGVPGVIISNIGNVDLGPEKTTGTEFGFELTALDERIDAGLNVFDQRTEDVLIGIQEAPSFGHPDATLRNLGEIESSGVEGTLRVTVLRGARLDWSVTGTYTTNNPIVTSLGPLSNHGAAVREGHPIRIAIGQVVANPGEVGVTPTYRNEVLGPLWPTKFFSIGTRVTFDQSWTLDILGEGQTGHVRTIGMAADAARAGGWRVCQAILERYRATGLTALTTQQLATCVPSYIRDGMWTDRADFFRIRSVSLSYRLPEDAIPQLDDVVVSLQGKHLMTFTDYQGLDPEAIDRGLSSEIPIEAYNMPQPRTFIVRVRVGF